ncbi:MAG: caspase family protein [Chitinophagaceae bacterium]|nr:caspase family protein [Chitinophagaceae bacterium]
MRKKTANICLLLIGFFLLNSVSFAQRGKRGLELGEDSTAVDGETYAIIIGLSQYKIVPSLQFADRDAMAFENYLTSEAGGKVPPKNIETFLNENATRNNIADAISIVARKAKPKDRVYFYFAGHGDMEDLTQIENGLLLLYNSPNGNYFGMKDDVLEILDLKRYLSPLSQKGIQMIFIIDACHSGNLKGGVQGLEQTAAALSASWGQEYKILSCQPNQVSLESKEWGGGRGLFSLELEEGMKGLADKNNDGKISFSELQRYITDQVATYSEEKQIPVVTGDLSKTFVTVDETVLAALKKQKEKDYPLLAQANIKGSEQKYIDSLNPEGQKLYAEFEENLQTQRLIWPKDTNAMHDYRLFTQAFPDNPLITTMRRNLAASLNDKFNTIVAPLLKGQTSYSNRDECYYAAAELDSCLSLLGNKHYMYPNIKARKLYMNAMSLIWGLSENEYNVSWNPTIYKAINYLTESEQLEPNAAYTVSALGISYSYLYEYEKADSAFQKYLALRPNDISAKYSLGIIYNNLKQYDKAAAIFEKLVTDYPGNANFLEYLANVYGYLGKNDKALSIIGKMIARDSTRANGYFDKGVFYSRLSQFDSAIYYYRKAGQENLNYKLMGDNNIGHVFFVANQLDSAKAYFSGCLTIDSTSPFPHFNLGVINAIEGDKGSAMDHFIKAVDGSSSSLSGFITNMQLYLGKTYDTTDQKAYKAFKKKVYIVNMRYISYISMLYTYFRIPGLIDSTKNIDFVFDIAFQFKQELPWTWYHYACWKSLAKNKTAALESLKKSLAAGFGDYFLIKNDHDLDFIRNTPEFKAMLKKYFPKKM